MPRVRGVTEQGERVAFLVRDRGAGQPEEPGVRQGGAHVITEGALLGAVRLIHQHDDVAAGVQLPGVLEPEDRGQHDPPLVITQQPPQLVLGLGDLDPREAGGAELAGHLLDQVEAVEHDHHRRPAHGLVVEQHQGHERHQQRLAGALVVPHQPAHTTGQDPRRGSPRRPPPAGTGGSASASPPPSRGPRTGRSPEGSTTPAPA